MRDSFPPKLISAWLIGLTLTSPAWSDAPVRLAPAVAASPYLKDMRRRMIAGVELSNSDLRQLADAGEGLAAARFAKRLEAKGDPAMLAEAAHSYSISVYADRDFALPRLIAILGRDNVVIKPARLKLMLKVLEGQIRQKDPIAAAGLADLLLRGRPFGHDIPHARDLLLVAAEAGDTAAAMRLAMSHFQGAPGLPPDPDAHRGYAFTERIRPMMSRHLVTLLRHFVIPCLTLLPVTAMAESASQYGCAALDTSALPTIEGSDGVFYRVRSDLRLQHPMDDIIVARLAELSRVLAEHGTTLVYVNLPAKGEAMPAYLRHQRGRGHPGACRNLIFRH